MRILNRILAFSKLNPPLFWNGFINSVSLLILIPALFLDERTVTNAPVWLKPIKFALSIGMYSFTLVWILQFVEGREKTIRGISWIVTAMLAVETVSIAFQAYRGIPSHFNITTPLNGFIFSLMGTAIGILWFFHIVLAIFLLRQKLKNKTLMESLRWGMGIAALGMILGFFMTIPRPEQIEQMKAGILEANGGHTFGAPEGGPGLPLVGWSMIAGDMRIPHFVGIHAMQLIPMVALLFGSFKVSQTVSVLAVRNFSIFFAGLIVVLTIQALSGEALLRPSTGIQIGFLICGLGMFGSLLFPFLSKKTFNTEINGV
ncbi:hypothetical protein [Leptospira yasudae]|uniref:Uncharacterized protein n=1 Tax=Leptospira yasudae TaxID=2202201 RepID=A0A6N4R0J8_9LEPT|nr:hypothetical protein [Leptospira yasudae]TGL80510.1 hypothetical protein EHQ72_07555 [Leptospira yasudae]TGL80975.1 hypothetical protein EHQ77_07410 [Leptospira yasudae]TGL85937.1 hypothetical protein EHQ83_06780 [Leptospira yasudae]